MKKYGIIAAVVAVVVGGIVGWNIFRSSDDCMASSIPVDATMVGRIDLKSMVLEYGMDLTDLTKMVFGKDMEAGINFKASAYVFAYQGYLGGVVALSDEEDFETQIRSNGYEIEEQRGLKWSVIDESILLAFNDDRAMVIGPAVGAERDALRNTLANSIKQKASDSGKQGRLYKLLDKRKEPVAMAASMSAVPANMLKEYTKYMNLRIEDIDLTAGFTAHKDCLTLNFGFQSDNPETSKQLEKMTDWLDVIDGDLSKNMPSNAVCHLAMGVDGEDLLEQLRANRTTRTLMLAANMVLDLDMIVKNIDGDVALSYVDDDGQTPQFLFQAQMDDDKFMKKMKDWNDATARSMGFSFYARDKNNAVCMYQDKPIYFTTKDKCLSISNAEAMARADAHTDAKWNLAPEMKGKRIYATMNLNRVWALTPEYRKGRMIPALQLFERLTFSLRDHQDMTFELMAPKGTDLLKELTKE